MNGFGKLGGILDRLLKHKYPLRTKSSSQKNGGRLIKVVEPEALTILREYEILWKRQEIDLARLAKLRWVEKLSLTAIATKMGIGKSTVRDRLQKVTPTIRGRVTK